MDQEIYREAVILADTHAVDISNKFPELLVSLRSCLNKKIKIFSSVKQLADLSIIGNAALSTSFQAVCTAFIFLTIPVTTAMDESFFPKLEIIKAYP